MNRGLNAIISYLSLKNEKVELIIVPKNLKI